jgi:hypothetical protein
MSGKNSDMVSLLVDAGARVGHANADGFTPLAAAAQSNDLRSLRILLENDADIGIRCKNGFSPVIWAMIGSESIEESDSDSARISELSTIAAHHSVNLKVSKISPCVLELLARAKSASDPSIARFILTV